MRRQFCAVHVDLKWRYLWRVGPRPQLMQQADSNTSPVVPQVSNSPGHDILWNRWHMHMQLSCFEVGRAELCAATGALGRRDSLELMHRRDYPVLPTGHPVACSENSN
eukprot:GHRQ01024866.1.p1 GENE.GHRQ01024866.1~~GHRQ01024866.1.p1  ORF type:complete len:108 (-),score=19.08 GHRQ01024866.1:445-768(-)